MMLPSWLCHMTLLVWALTSHNDSSVTPEVCVAMNMTFPAERTDVGEVHKNENTAR